MPRSASVGGLAKRGVIPQKQFYIKLFIYNTVVLGQFNTPFYLGNYPELASSGMNPLLHFVGRGSH